MGVALTPDGMFASAFDPGDQQCVDGIMLDPKDAGMELGWEREYLLISLFLEEVGVLSEGWVGAVVW